MAVDECDVTIKKNVVVGKPINCDVTIAAISDTIVQPVHIPVMTVNPDENVVVNFTPSVQNNDIRLQSGNSCEVSPFSQNNISVERLPSQDTIIELFSIKGGLQEAPKTGQLYGRKNGQWIVVPPSSGSCSCPPPVVDPPTCEVVDAGLFVTDVTNTGSGLIANKSYLAGTVPPDKVLVSALTDDDTATVHFMAEGGKDYSPRITVDGMICSNLQQYSNDQRLFFGSVNVHITNSRTIELSSSEGSTAEVIIERAEAPPEILTCLIGTPPGSQTAVKAGDTVMISGTVEQSATHIMLSYYGACNGTGWLPISNGSFVFAATVSANSGDLPVRITARNVIGSEGSEKTSDNTILLDQQYPVFTFNNVLYPFGQSAFKDTESGQISVDVEHFSSVHYSSPTGEFIIDSPDAYLQSKIIDFTNTNNYNDHINNYQINAYKVANGSSSIFNHVIHVADTAPLITVTQAANRLRSSPAGANYLIQANSDQILTAPPQLNIPVSGTWVGGFTGFEKNYSCNIQINDGDASGSAPYALTVDVYNEAGIAASITGNEVVGGFVGRNIDLPPFATHSTLDARVTDIQKLRMSWSFKSGMVFQPIGTSPPIVNGWTIDAVNQNQTDVIILDTSAANSSSQASVITISEDV